MTYISDLTTARDNYAALLAAGAHDGQTTYSVDGRSFDWIGYSDHLLNRIEQINRMLAQYQPSEIRTIALG